jgi:hypothetical protein
MSAAPHEHDKFLKSLHEDALNYDHHKASFLANEGDVLIWHADLAHGGLKSPAEAPLVRAWLPTLPLSTTIRPICTGLSREPIEEQDASSYPSIGKYNARTVREWRVS